MDGIGELFSRLFFFFFPPTNFYICIIFKDLLEM